MKRIIVPIVVVVVVLVVGYGVGQLTAPKAAAPVSISSPAVPRQIDPNMPTGSDIAVAPPPQAVAAPSPNVSYGPNREEVGAAIEAGIKKYRETNQGDNQPPPKLQPLNVQ
jgi:hypothetical protein